LGFGRRKIRRSSFVPRVDLKEVFKRTSCPCVEEANEVLRVLIEGEREEGKLNGCRVLLVLKIVG